MQTWVRNSVPYVDQQWMAWMAWPVHSVDRQVAKPARHAACWPPCARCGPSSPPQIAMGPPPAGMACWDTTAPGAGYGMVDGWGRGQLLENRWKWMDVKGCSLGCSCIWFASRIRLFKRCCKPTKPSASIYIYMYSIYQINHMLTMGMIPPLILSAQWWSNLKVEVAMTFMWPWRFVQLLDLCLACRCHQVPWLLAAQVPTIQPAWGQ